MVGLRRYGPTVAYLDADHKPSDSEVVIYVILEDYPLLSSMDDDLTVSYVAESGEKQRMRFAIGKSNADGSRHLIAWKLKAETPPSTSDRIEIADVTGKLLATISRIHPSGVAARNGMDE